MSLASTLGSPVVQALFDRIDTALADRVFRCRDEADLQTAVVARLREADSEWSIDTEVRTRGGRFDVVVWWIGIVVVLELKMRASAAVVERQAMRYCNDDHVDGVAVVTTSQRLATQIRSETLGGKPFRVIAVRTT